MVKGVRLVAVVGLGLLAACTRPVDDPLAVNGVYWGLAPMPDYDGPLPEVLWSADDTPAKQSLLYTAMVEAEVAAQYAGRALAAEDSTSVRSALGEVLYALDPETAPDWEAKAAGIVQGWAGTGYGLQRAAAGMAAEIRAAAADDDAPAALGEYGLPAVRCAENTLERAERLLLLSREALDAAAPGADPLLEQIRALADQLNGGPGAPAEAAAVDPACGLQQAERYLSRLTPGPG